MLNATEVTDGITAGVAERQMRGMQIAAVCKVKRCKDGLWEVPSQSGVAKYKVKNTGLPTCTCPDHETRGCKCKHIYAVEYVIRREQCPDGTEAITHQLTVTERVPRPTYSQVWPAYNAAQTNEKEQFQILLRDICSGIEEPEQHMGRKRIPLSDSIFSAAFKVYSTVSGRRFTCDLNDALAKGYISRAPHYNSIFRCFESPAVTPSLKSMIERSSMPLRAVETDFAVDATGFSSCRFARWFNFKYCEERIAKDWVKLHLVCGVNTNVVSAVEVSERFQHDSPFMPALVNQTVKNFNVREVSADKGYHGRENYHAIEAIGAAPFIPFKTSSKTEWDNKTRSVNPQTMWNRMYHLYHFKRDEFLPHYHKRSNVESTFMAIKAKYGDAVRSKTLVAQINEVLCKVLCHNVCCVIQSMYELGVEPLFALKSE